MASVKRKELQNGRIVYRIIIYLGHDKKGNNLCKNLTYTVNQSATQKQQEKEAIKYAMDMEDKIKYGHDCNADKILFYEFADKWLNNIKSEIAYSSYENYEMLLNSKIIPYFKSYRLIHIKTPLIEAFYKTLTNQYSYGTIKKCANILSGMFKAAIRWNMIEINPCQNAHLPRVNQEQNSLKYFTPQQSIMFLKSLDIVYEITYKGHERIDDTGIPYYVNDYSAQHKVSTQYKVFYHLSLFCGFRKSETLALHWSDIDLDKREISISKTVGLSDSGVIYKNPKTATSVRKVSFPSQIVPLLRQYRTEYNLLRLRLGSAWQGNDNLFIQADGKLMGRSTPYHFFKRHLGRYNEWVQEHKDEATPAGLEELPNIPLHGLRHSCATLLNYLDVNIIDISKILGHAKSSTTMDIYAHSFEEQKMEAANKLESFLKKQA